MSSLAVRMTVAVLAALVLLCSVVLSQPSPPPLSSRPNVISTLNTGHHRRIVTAMGAESDAVVIAGTASPSSPATDNTDHHDATAMFGEGGTTLQGSESFGDQCPPAAALFPRLDRVSLKTILRELGVNSCYAFAKISHALKVPSYPLHGSVPTVQYCNWVDTWATTGTSFSVEKAEDIYAQCDCIAPYVPPIDRLGLGRVVRALKIHDPAAVETIATALQMPPCGSVTVAQLCRWLRDHGPQCPPFPHPATETPLPTAPTTPAPESEDPTPGQSQSGGPKPYPEPSTPAPETEPWPSRAPEETQAPMTYPPRPWPTPAPSSLPAGPSSHTGSAGVPVSLSSVMSPRSSSFGPPIGSSASASAATSSAPTAGPLPHMPSPAPTSAPGAPASGPPPALSGLPSSTPRGSQTQSSMSNGAGAPVSSSTHGFAPTSSPDEDGSIPQKHIVFVCVVLGLSAIAAVVSVIVVLCCLRRRCPHKCPMLTDVMTKTGVPKTPAKKKKKAAPIGDNTTAPTSDFSSAGGDEEIVMPADFEGIVEGRPIGAVTPPYPPLVLQRSMPRPPRATSRVTSRAAPPSASLRHTRHVDVSIDLSPQNAQRLAVPGVVFSDTQSSPTFACDRARDRASPQQPEAPLQMPALANDVERSTVVEMTRPQTAPQYPVIQIPLPQRRQEGRSRRDGSAPKVDGKAPKIHPEPQNPLAVKRHVVHMPPL